MADATFSVTEANDVLMYADVIANGSANILVDTVRGLLTSLKFCFGDVFY